MEEKIIFLKTEGPLITCVDDEGCGVDSLFWCASHSDSAAKYWALFFWYLESIAGAAYGFEIARVLGIDFNLCAELAHVDIDRARGDEGSLAPDRVQDLIAGEDAPGVLGKVMQQAELGGSRCHQCAPDGQG